MTNDVRNVGTREARSQLTPRRSAYWQEFDSDSHLGYYKAKEVRVWIVRLDRGKKQLEERIPIADDIEDADGVRVMDFRQARTAAHNWCAAQITKEARQPIDGRPFMSTGPACNRD